MRAVISAFYKIERWKIKLHPCSVTFAICSSFLLLSVIPATTTEFIFILWRVLPCSLLIQQSHFSKWLFVFLFRVWEVWSQQQNLFKKAFISFSDCVGYCVPPVNACSWTCWLLVSTWNNTFSYGTHVLPIFLFFCPLAMLWIKN